MIELFSSLKKVIKISDTQWVVSKQTDGTPKSDTKKAELQKWLTENGIPFPPWHDSWSDMQNLSRIIIQREII